MKKKNNPKLIEKQLEKEEIISFSGYPLYPASEDIYSKFRKDLAIDPEEAADMQESMDRAKVHTRNESDLDVPGSELDDEQENIGSEDEENNYYSLGGDNHADLEENKR